MPYTFKPDDSGDTLISATEDEKEELRRYLFTLRMITLTTGWGTIAIVVQNCEISEINTTVSQRKIKRTVEKVIS